MDFLFLHIFIKNGVGRLYLLNEKILFQIMRNTYPCFIHVKSQNIKDYDKNPLSFFVCFWNVGYNTFKRILDKYPRVDNAQYCNRMLSYVFCSYQQNKWNLVSFLYVFTSSNIALTSSLMLLWDSSYHSLIFLLPPMQNYWMWNDHIAHVVFIAKVWSTLMLTSIIFINL